MIAQVDESVVHHYIQRAIKELHAARMYLHAAKHCDPLNQRVIFHYDWLLSDLGTIEQGLRQKFNLPASQLRVIRPVKGDYVTFVGERNPP